MDKFRKMSYKEFKNYCNERACDGQWSVYEALACIAFMAKIDSIKGFFKNRSREKEWKKLIEIKIRKE